MIKALFAVDLYGGMGYEGSLPWPHNPADMKNFQDLTLGQVVVMGRRSWDDPKMPKPLVGRTVYVASHKPVRYARQISGDLDQEVLAIEKNHPNQIVWVVGGPKILEACQGIFDRIHLTYIKGSYKIDTRIDLRSFLGGWKPVYGSAAPDTGCNFIVYENVFKRSTTST